MIDLIPNYDIIKHRGSMIKNWFDMEAHPTDNMIHRSESGKKRNAHAKKLREAYDKIKAVGLLKELEYLIEESDHASFISVSETNDTDF